MCVLSNCPLLKRFIHRAKKSDFGSHFPGQSPHQGTPARPSQTIVLCCPSKISFEIKIKQLVFNDLQNYQTNPADLGLLKTVKRHEQLL
jgi:hypothetical protein